MRLIKKAMTIVLSVAMALTVVPVSAAGDNSADNTFYYVAIGDSATAGYGLESLTDEQRSTAVFLNHTYKAAFKDAYPTLVASTLRDVLLEEGYISSGKKFDFSNLGTAAYRTKDCYEVFVDEEHISGLFAPNYEAQYGSIYNSYKANPEGFRKYVERNTKTRLRETLDEYFGNYGDTTLQTQLADWGLKWNSENEFLAFYNSNCSTDAKFDAWFNQIFDSYYYDNYLPAIRGDQYKYHKIYTEECAKADLITLNIGANDLLLNLMLRFREEAQQSGNPIMLILYKALHDLTLGGNEVTVFLNLQSNILKYRSSTTAQHVDEAEAFLKDENLRQLLSAYTDIAIESYPKAVAAIKEVNHAAGKDALLVFMSTYYPYHDAPDISSYAQQSSLNEVIAEKAYQAMEDEGILDDPAITVDGVADDSAVAEVVYGAAQQSDEAMNILVESAEEVFGQEYMDLDDGQDDECLSSLEEEAVNTNAQASWQDTLKVNRFYLTLDMARMTDKITKASLPCIARFNNYVEAFAAKEQAPYVDIYDVCNEYNYDPHPTAETHKKIADRVIAEVVENISVTKTGGGTVSAPARCLYGHDVSVTATPNPGNKVNAVTVNGTRTTLGSSSPYTFSLNKITDDAAVRVEFGSGGTGQTTYTLKFVTNGGDPIDSVICAPGTTVNLAEYIPNRNGYTFSGWYLDTTFKTGVSSVTVNGDTTVYAYWKAQSSGTRNFLTLFNKIINRYVRNPIFRSVNDTLEDTDPSFFRDYLRGSVGDWFVRK